VVAGWRTELDRNPKASSEIKRFGRLIGIEGTYNSAQNKLGKEIEERKGAVSLGGATLVGLGAFSTTGVENICERTELFEEGRSCLREIALETG